MPTPEDQAAAPPGEARDSAPLTAAEVFAFALQLPRAALVCDAQDASELIAKRGYLSDDRVHVCRQSEWAKLCEAIDGARVAYRDAVVALAAARAEVSRLTADAGVSADRMRELREAITSAVEALREPCGTADRMRARDALVPIYNDFIRADIRAARATTTEST